MDSATAQRLIPLVATSITLILIRTTRASSFLDNRTAYEILEDYDFPVGLLPVGIKGYDIDNTTGRFSTYFNNTCSFSLENSYQLKYDPTIKGYISNRKLSSLEGIYVWLIFAWMEIVEIIRHGDDLHFSLGVLSSSFPVNWFEESPQCGCGFQCGSGRVRQPRINPRVNFSLLKGSEDKDVFVYLRA